LNLKNSEYGIKKKNFLSYVKKTFYGIKKIGEKNEKKK